MEVANKLDLESFHQKKEMCVCDRTDVLGDALMTVICNRKESDQHA